MADTKGKGHGCRFVKRYVNTAYIGGENLRLHRERVGLTKTELAKQLTALTGIDIDRRRIKDREDSFEFEAGPSILAALRKVLQIS